MHYTPNETISGVEFQYVPATRAVPLVADMSSTLLSRPIDVSKFGLIYAGAQKNIGPSGLTLVIVREDLLGRARPETPTVFNYKAVADEGSLLNTPPTFAWYVAGLVFKWLKKSGGLSAMAERNSAKARALYAAIDGSSFYRNRVAKDARSWMNVTFTLDEARSRRGISRAGRRRGAAPISRATARWAGCVRASTMRCRSPASRRSSASCASSSASMREGSHGEE